MTDICTIRQQALSKKRLGFPTSLYKYRYFDDKGYWKDWIKGKIFLSKPSSFNDPYDCLLSNNLVTPKRYLLVSLLKGYLYGHFKLTKDEIDAISQANDPLEAFRSVLAKYNQSLGTKFDRSFLNKKQFQTNFKKLLFLGCFSEVNDSILMWSHYSDHHRGFCIEYDFNNNVNIRENTFPIIYADKAIIDYNNGDIEEAFQASLLCKATCWSYEKEWRYYMSNADFARKTRMSIDASSSIKCLYVGAQIKAEDHRSIKDLALQLNIPLKYMKMDDYSFCLHVDSK